MTYDILSIYPQLLRNCHRIEIYSAIFRKSTFSVLNIVSSFLLNLHINSIIFVQRREADPSRGLPRGGHRAGRGRGQAHAQAQAAQGRQPRARPRQQQVPARQAEGTPQPILMLYYWSHKTYPC